MHQGRRHVVLRNVRGTMAVYRETPRGRLQKLETWPRALGEW
jgi:hypothetical protein